MRLISTVTDHYSSLRVRTAPARSCLRFGIISLLLIFTFSSVISLLPASTTPVSAAATKTATLDPLGQAQAFAYYKALRACMEAVSYKNFALFGNRNTMSQQNAIDFEWFNDMKIVVGVFDIPIASGVNGINVGAFNDPRKEQGDGSQNCGGAEGKIWLPKMASVFGYTSGPELLCDLGFTRQSSSVACTSTAPGATNDFIKPASNQSALDQFWNSKLGNASQDIDSITGSGGAYRIYLDNFMSQCRPAESSSGIYTIQIYDNTSKSWTPKKYGAADRDRGEGYQVTVWHGKTMTCRELANAIDKGDDPAVIGYKSWLDLNRDGETDTPGGFVDCDADPENEACTEEFKTTCAVDEIGWMVCPLLNALGGMSDLMFSWIEGALTLNPLSVVRADDPDTELVNEATTQNSVDAVFTTWQTMRDISNVALVIAFLIIIFSQMSGVGVSNYGIKKMIPRLVIVAIAINASYFIMAIAFDLANILGVSIKQIFDGLASSVSAENMNWADVIATFVSGTLATGGAVVAGVAIVGATGLPASALALLALPFIVVAVLCILAAFATLFIRNALVIVLAVISPLAFAAYLLPNTEKLFTKWRTLTVSMLMLFPMAALLFGAAKFSSYLILGSGTTLGVIAALFIMAAPLGMLPFLIKSSNSLLSGIYGGMERLAKATKAPMQKGLKNRVENQRAQYQAGQRGFFGRRRTQAQMDRREIKIRLTGRGRTNAEKWNEKRMRLTSDTEGLQKRAKEQFTQRAERAGQYTNKGAGKEARRMREVLNEHSDTAEMSKANTNLGEARAAARRASPNTFANRQATLAFDADKQAGRSQSQFEESMSQRVRSGTQSTAGGGSLQAIHTDTTVAKENTKANEMAVDNVSRQDNAVQAAVLEQGRQNVTAERIKAQEAAALDNAKATEGGLVQEVLTTEGAKLASTTSQGNLQEIVEQSKESGALNAQAVQARVATEDAKTAQVKADNAIRQDTNVREAIVAQGQENLTTERINNEEKKALNESIPDSEELMAEVYGAKEAKNDADTAQSKVDAAVSYAESRSGAVVPEAARGLRTSRMKAEGAKAVAGVREGQVQTQVDEIKSGIATPGQNFAGSEALQDLRWSGTQERVNADAQAIAKSAGAEVYAEAVMDGAKVASSPGGKITSSTPTIATQSGGKVDPRGADLATARAVASANRAESEDIEAARQVQAQRVRENSKPITDPSTGAIIKSGDTAGQEYAQAELDAALASKDSVKIRAAYHVLQTMGEGGITRAQASLATAVSTGVVASDDESMDSLKSYIKSTFPDTKIRDNRINSWADGNDAALTGGGGHLNGMTDREIVGQSAASLYDGYAGVVDDIVAGRILAAADSGQYDVKGKQRAILEAIRDGNPIPSP